MVGHLHLVPMPFVAKFTGDGNTLLFSTYVGASGLEALKSLALDASGNVYLIFRTSTHSNPRSDLPRGAQRLRVEDAFLAEIAAKPQVIHANAAANAELHCDAGVGGDRESVRHGIGDESDLSARHAVAGPTLGSASFGERDSSAALLRLAGTGEFPGAVRGNLRTGGDSDCFRSRYDDPAGAGCANAPGMFTLNSQGTAAGAIEHSISYELVAETNPAGAGEIIPI